MFGKRIALLACAALGIALATPALAQSVAAPALSEACKDRDGWSDPAPPAHIFGNTWYVGTCGITVLLIKTEAGLALIDSGPADAAPLVLANIRKLGFDPAQVKWILSTHEHHDHAGGIAILQKATGARLAAGQSAAEALRSGKPYADDPQYEVLMGHAMQPARVDRALASGQVLKLGTMRFTAYRTPTHSPGSTSWTWQDCEEGRCITLAMADSISTISADGYKFSQHPQRLLPIGIGFLTIERMPCDILLTPHPGSSDLFARLSGAKPLVDAGACKAYAQAGRARFNTRLADEGKQQTPQPRTGKP